MNVLDEFNKLLDIKFSKFNNYLEEGKTSEEAFKLLEPDVNELIYFIKKNQEEFQEELYKDIDKSDPMRKLLISTLFPNYEFEL